MTDGPARPRGTVQVVVTAVPLLVGLPLAGMALGQHALARYFDFPPRTCYVAHAPFSWPVFVLMSAFVAACVGPFLAALVRAAPRAPAAPPRGRFPGWGWLGLAVTAVGWTVAWTRLPMLASVQSYTFLPLWIGYIVVVNALVAWRGGRCPLTVDTGFYLGLFPTSALFWWFFEYLNRFVQNWYYVGLERFTAGEYVFWSSLSFATVLPAVYATRALLATWPRLSAGLEGGPAVPILDRRTSAAAVLVLASIGLAALGLRPDWTFPLLWIAPFAVIAALQALGHQPHALTPVARGDWRGVWLWALAALVCGGFWETWNYYSAAKWVYAVPYVQRFAIFEMPVLGFAGYLPFGLECATATALCAGLAGRSGTDAGGFR